MIAKILINAAHPEECRVAVVVDGILEELDVQVKTHEATLGNIYKGVVSRVEPSLQAVFVEYGPPRKGFLSISDVHSSYFPESYEESRRRPKIEDVFKKGDHVIVQVAKEERNTKGASLTTNISLAGRYLVLMPGTDLHGVSRKIVDEKERKKLRDIGKQLKLPEHIGFIIRTAGMGRTKTELTRDLNYLLNLWKAIENQVAEETPPALLYREQDVVIRSIRDHFTPDIAEILVDVPPVYNKAKDFFRQVMPKQEGIVRLYQEKRPIFNKYQLEGQVEQVQQKRINLKSGGYIIIEPTEALVTVDVNSGSATKERWVEDTAFRVNMEAAAEIARQLRLRDLGGIVVIDFIDMMNKKHKLEVERKLRAELKRDRAKTKVLRISSLGLLEMSRQRLKSTLGTGGYLDCPFCGGQGKIRSRETAALTVFRRIKSLLIKPDVSEVVATAPHRVADYLLNNMRSELVACEQQYNGRIIIRTQEVTADNEISVEAVKEEPPEDLVTPEEATSKAITEEVEAVSEPAAGETEKRRPKRAPRRRRKPRKRPPQNGETSEVEQDAESADSSPVPRESDGEETRIEEPGNHTGQEDLGTAGASPADEAILPRTGAATGRELPDAGSEDGSEADESQSLEEREPADDMDESEDKPRSKVLSLRRFLPFS